MNRLIADIEYNNKKNTNFCEICVTSQSHCSDDDGGQDTTYTRRRNYLLPDVAQNDERTEDV